MSSSCEDTLWVVSMSAGAITAVFMTVIFLFIESRHFMAGYCDGYNH